MLFSTDSAETPNWSPMYNVTETVEASNGDSTATTNDFYASESSYFSNNILIALAALMCALIFALCLNSLVRCSLRLCSHKFDPERVKRRALHRIPVVPYKAEVSIAVTDCPICLSEFSDGEKVRILPDCNHDFHVDCIDKWLLLHSTCPLCRKQPFEQPRIAEEVNRNVVGVC